MARPKASDSATETVAATPSEKPAISTARGWYWFGMLPAPEPIQWPVPTGKLDGMSGEYFAHETFDPWRMWNRQERINRDFSVWAGKCRFFQSLPISGFTFPAFSNYTETQETGSIFQPYPGAVHRMQAGGFVTDDVTAEHVIKSCFRHFIRFPYGIERMMEPNQNVAIWNLAKNAKPDEFTDAEWAKYPHEAPPVFDPLRDAWVSEFVYFVKLNVPERPTGFDEREYARNPNKFHATLVGGMTQEFFKNPPKSVAEMYGEKK